MNRLAQAHERERVALIGAQVVALIEAMIRDYARPDTPEEMLSQELGRLLVSSVFLAANDIEWLNRPCAIQGMGMALGELIGAFPYMADGVRRRLEAGLAEGEVTAAELMQPKGSA